MNSDEISLYNNELDEDIIIFVSGFKIMKGGSWVFVIELIKNLSKVIIKLSKFDDIMNLNLYSVTL